jgi:hypothetical protein
MDEKKKFKKKHKKDINKLTEALEMQACDQQ